MGKILEGRGKNEKGMEKKWEGGKEREKRNRRKEIGEVVKENVEI